MKPSQDDFDAPERVSRRNFLKGAGITVAAVGVTGPAAMPGAPVQDAEEVPIVGPGPTVYRLTVNGKEHAVTAEPMSTLLDLLRDTMDLTGAKRVCNRGFCGACTVLIDGRTVNSCSFLAIDAIGSEITTIEGLSGEDEPLTPIQEAFVHCDALQCGFCTPGMVMSCTALLAQNGKPGRDEIAAGISGNLCRCGTYQNVIEAVELVSGRGGRGK